jgi:hypothetical protein
VTPRCRHDGDYTDAGADYYERRDQRSRDHMIRYHQSALARLGVHVTPIPRGDGSPPPGIPPGTTHHQAA